MLFFSFTFNLGNLIFGLVILGQSQLKWELALNWELLLQSLTLLRIFNENYNDLKISNDFCLVLNVLDCFKCIKEIFFSSQKLCTKLKKVSLNWFDDQGQKLSV